MTDPIERQQAIDAIRKIQPWEKVALWDVKAEKVRDFYFIDKEKAQTELMMLPSAQQKTGHWIEHKWAEEVNEMLIPNYECSECHYWERYDSNFCPNCGAKMQKGETDEVEGRI